MRIDDNSIDKKMNLVLAKERQRQKELKKSGMFKCFPNLKNIIFNKITDLPIEKDHHYYHMIEHHKELPNLVIYDVKNLKNGNMMQYYEYDENKMISSEL